MQLILNHLPWFIAGAVVVIGLFGIGAGDLIRFRMRRVWAISSVCFAESIRRKVLWITPLAIVGVIIVAQLQRPIDEQDAIRQTTKFCLFTTGLLVSITSVILACTNLPKEIENRVIYTIVTKPATRLEIILGKIVGFARVSGTILIIMGVFTLGYLGLRAWTMGQAINQRLQSGAVDSLSKPTLEHYQQVGLLNAKSYAFPVDLQTMGELSTGGKYWMDGGGEQSVAVRFRIPADYEIPSAPGQDNSLPALLIKVQIGAVVTVAPSTQPQQPLPIPFISPAKNMVPRFGVQLMDTNFNTVVNPSFINNGQQFDATPQVATDGIVVKVPINAMPELLRSRDFYVQLTGMNTDAKYWVGDAPIHVYEAGPVPDSVVAEIQPVAIPGIPFPAGRPFFQGRQGTFGQQLKGVSEIDKAPVAIYHFRNIPKPDAPDGQVQLELRIGVERSGLDSSEDNDDPTILSIQTRNPASSTLSKPFEVRPDSGHTAYFSIPAADVYDGNFDLVIKNLTNGHWAGFQPIVPGARPSLSLVLQNRPMGFVINLAKSLFILWLMSILVIVISIFCSVWLSWPIAVVLTLVILLGHWGVEQISDVSQPGIGNQIATDFGVSDPAGAKVLSSSVEGLSRGLNLLAKVLPDISQFSATEDIERGISIPFQRVVDALKVIAAFGLPLGVAAYVVLKYKEVAP